MQEMEDPKDQEKKKTTTNQQARTSANTSVLLVREGRNMIRVQEYKSHKWENQSIFV